MIVLNYVFLIGSTCVCSVIPSLVSFVSLASVGAKSSPYISLPNLLALDSAEREGVLSIEAELGVLPSHD